LTSVFHHFKAAAVLHINNKHKYLVYKYIHTYIFFITCTQNKQYLFFLDHVVCCEKFAKYLRNIREKFAKILQKIREKLTFANFSGLFHKFFANILQILIFRDFFVNFSRIFCKFFANISQIFRKFFTNILRIFRDRPREESVTYKS